MKKKKKKRKKKKERVCLKERVDQNRDQNQRNSSKVLKKKYDSGSHRRQSQHQFHIYVTIQRFPPISKGFSQWKLSNQLLKILQITWKIFCKTFLQNLSNHQWNHQWNHKWSLLSKGGYWLIVAMVRLKFSWSKTRQPSQPKRQLKLLGKNSFPKSFRICRLTNFCCLSNASRFFLTFVFFYLSD